MKKKVSFLSYLKKYWFFAIISPLFMIGEVLIDLMQPKLMSRIINTVVESGELDVVMSSIFSTAIEMIVLVAIGGFMGSYWGAGDTIGGIMFSESSPTNLRSSVTVINTLLNGVMGGLATVITMILLPIIPERMFGYMYLGLTVPGLVGAIVIMWLFVGETRGLDLKTVTGTEWDKPKKVKEEQQEGE